MPAVSSHSIIIDVIVHCINAPAAAPFSPSCLYAWTCFTMTLMTSTSAYNLEAVTEANTGDYVVHHEEVA